MAITSTFSASADAVVTELVAKPTGFDLSSIAAFERHAAERKSPAWQVRAAECMNRWGIGFELSGADFEAALAAVLEVRIGGDQSQQ